MSGMGSECLEIYPQALAVPPLHLSGFEVTLSTTHAGLFEQKLNYLINGRYKYKVLVRAQVVPATLVLSSTSFDFAIAPTAEPTFARDLVTNLKAERLVRITNPGNYPASFSWLFPCDGAAPSGTDMASRDGLLDRAGSVREPFPSAILNALPDLRLPGLFKVEPAQGVVAPHASVDVSITYIPGYEASLTQTLTFQVLDRATSTPTSTNEGRHVVGKEAVVCHGSIVPTGTGSANLPKGQLLDLGTISLCNPESQHLRPFQYFVPQPDAGPAYRDHKGRYTLKLRNPSTTHACFFTTDLQRRTPALTLSMSYGVIPPNTAYELVITASPTHTGLVEDALMVYFGGAPAVHVPLRFEGVALDVCITVADGQFLDPEVVLGTSSINVFEVLNHGTAISRVLVDLR